MERLLLECAIRSTLIAAGAAAVLSAMRIKNVAARHSTWTSVLVLMLALPLLVASGRSVPLRILPPPQQNIEQVAQPSDEKVPFIPPKIGQALTETPRAETRAGRTAWSQWIEGIYFVGVTVLLLRLLTGMIGAHRLKRQARQVEGRLTSASCSSPITVGWVHAMTILPEGWQDWEPAKLDAVLTHESEHARRYDPLVQWLALVNRALFWFHPLAWWLDRRLAALSEEACDFAVLERGHDAGDYSRYLLDLARSVNDSHHRIRLLGMTMPGSYLPQRIQKMLRGGVAPKVSFLRIAFATAVFFLLCVGFSTAIPVRAEVLSVAALRAQDGTPRTPMLEGAKIKADDTAVVTKQIAALVPPVQPPIAAKTASAAQVASGILTGAVHDPNGTLLPSATITIGDERGQSRATISDPDGRFVFTGLPAGQYALQVELPGFRTHRENGVTVVAGITQKEVNLSLASLAQSVVVSASDPPPVHEAAWRIGGGVTSWRIRGNVNMATLLTQVKPEYPPALKGSGIETSVTVEAVVGTDGQLTFLKVTPSLDGSFVAASLAALRDWRYSPATLNGVPVEVVTTITVDFKP